MWFTSCAARVHRFSHKTRDARALDNTSQRTARLQRTTAVGRPSRAARIGVVRSRATRAVQMRRHALGHPSVRPTASQCGVSLSRSTCFAMQGRSMTHVLHGICFDPLVASIGARGIATRPSGRGCRNVTRLPRICSVGSVVAESRDQRRSAEVGAVVVQSPVRVRAERNQLLHRSAGWHGSSSGQSAQLRPGVAPTGTSASFQLKRRPRTRGAAGQIGGKRWVFRRPRPAWGGKETTASTETRH